MNVCFHRRILADDVLIPKHLSPEAGDLICRLLEKNPKKRLGAGQHGVDEIKTHPFFAVSFPP
jgi:serine/threonine protein kinase